MDDNHFGWSYEMSQWKQWLQIAIKLQMIKILWKEIDKTNVGKFPLKIAMGKEAVSLKWCTFLGVYFLMMMITLITFKELVMMIFFNMDTTNILLVY